MPLNRDQIRSGALSCTARATPLQALAAELVNLALDPAATEEAIEAKFRELEQLRIDFDASFQELAKAFGAAGDQATSATFSDFLGEVGDAVVTAQKRLDAHNLAALEAVAGGGPPPMGVFRLPKLHGEIRFAVSQVSRKKLGLIFYSRGTEEESRNEQMVNFDIVSVPPPPDLLQAVASMRPDLHMVLDPSEREAVFAALRNVQVLEGAAKAEGEPHEFQNKLLERHRSALQGEPDAVIVLPANALGSDGKVSYLLLYADRLDREDWLVGVWQLELDGPRLHVLWRLDAKGTQHEDVGRFKLWVRDLADRQIRLLRYIRGDS